MRFVCYGTLLSGNCSRAVGAALGKLSVGVPAIASGLLMRCPMRTGGIRR